MEVYKCKMGFAVTLMDVYATTTTMMEKSFELPFVPRTDMLIETDDMHIEFKHVKYTMPTNTFVCVCTGASSRDLSEYDSIIKNLENRGWVREGNVDNM